MRRAEGDEFDLVDQPAPRIGGAEVIASEDDHGSHMFLYVPDLTIETGWSAHRVPKREQQRTDRRPMGFRR